MDRHFKSLIELLRLFVDNPVRATKKESHDEDAASALKCERKEKEEQKEGEEASETFRLMQRSARSNHRSRTINNLYPS